jgi:hypothetical protein
VTLKVKFADFELISRSRTLVGAIGSRDELESASAELLKALFPLQQPVRLLGVAISGFSIAAFAMRRAFLTKAIWRVIFRYLVGATPREFRRSQR